ncbi:MAG: hypothetical protein FDX18_01905 [Chlorobium sp.]|nr:MAG: hypothetical protein FDX18_01905 [Chlorobium sp.]
MPQNSSETFIEERKAHNAARTEMMESEESEEIADHIFMEILRTAMDEMRHILQELMEESENGCEGDARANPVSSLIKSTSAKTAGIACQTKKIEQRYRM